MPIFTNKPPRSIRVGRANYSVEMMDCPDEDKNCLGQIVFDDREIHIKKKMTRSEIDSVILHELVHAIAHHYGLRMSEKTVLKMEKALVDLFLKNNWKIQN